MFSFDDMGTFAWAFFIVLPLTLLIHSGGHAFFAYLFGGKTSLTIGRGGKLLKVKNIEIRKFYFIDSACYYDQLRKDRRWKHALIYAGGPIFNIASILIVNGLIHANILPAHLFFYQFVYFSVYLVFFALIPIDYGENNPSDGKAIYDVMRYGKIYKEFN
ncbi:site-2 protease family protein [Domibacillus robiginosus]|uniref:site-2 protease family protein n=1 Tax=Domibacillus robiginosus TaxID=1071054 RepID=UPI00067DDD86|nr:site-2 protease family protein [Domibacillus robiginosus]